jgi:hypothetical protein
VALKDVLVKGGLEDNATMDGKDLRLCYKVTQDVGGILDCVRIFNDSFEGALIGKEENVMPNISCNGFGGDNII